MQPKPEANNQQRESALPSATLLADLDSAETRAWDNMRAKEEQLKRATDELREAVRMWGLAYAKAREVAKQHMSANEKNQKH